MKRCPIENTWHPNEYRYCPDCGTELERNEVSSEDGDDGLFVEQDNKEKTNDFVDNQER